MVNREAWQSLTAELAQHDVTLVAVSKTKPVSDIQSLYDLGQRDFGENYVQELVEKQAQLPGDIRWHFIGHLQSNKVKYIAPFVHLIHGVDNFRLLQEINKQASRHGRRIDVLLQQYIAAEETKFGMDEKELTAFTEQYTAQQDLHANVRICGLMGMASFTDDEAQLREEFGRLAANFRKLKETYFRDAPHFSILSAGMTSDYRLAVAAGSTMVRVGSLLFGSR